MKPEFRYLIGLCILLILPQAGWAQSQSFTTAANVKNLYGGITSLAEDSEGYIWFGCNTNIGGGGLHRFDGKGINSFMHDPHDSNSLAENSVTSLVIDSKGMIWIGTWGEGLDRFDPVAETFTHYRYHAKEKGSLSCDFVKSLVKDKEGNLWIGTSDGLNKLNPGTGKFVRFFHEKNNPSTLSNDLVQTLYMDHEGRIWIGTDYGLNLFIPRSGKFTNFFPCKNAGQNICSNSISVIFEDSRRNLWIGTYEAGLLTLDRKTGEFTHYYYDSSNSDKPAPPPLNNRYADPVTIISEDAAGSLWIGAYAAGINCYNPASKKTIHYSRDVKNDRVYPYNGFRRDSMTTQPSCTLLSKNGLFWMGTTLGGLYVINPLHKTVPYFPVKQQSANSFSKDASGVLWIATDNGLLEKFPDGRETVFTHDPKNPQSISVDGIYDILSDGAGNLWLGTNGGGLDKFNTTTHNCLHYTHNDNDPQSLSNGNVLCLFKDSRNILWVATAGGLDKLEESRKSFIHYRNIPDDSTSISNNLVISMVEETNHLWAATIRGLNRLDEQTGRWTHYLPNSTIKSVFIDHRNIIWAGAGDGLFFYDRLQDSFALYRNPGTRKTVNSVLNITEDNDHQLWITTSDALYRINDGRNRLFKFGTDEGIHPNQFLAEFSYKSKDGQLFIGDQGGYYAFFPGQLQGNVVLPAIYFTDFRLKNREIKPGSGKLLLLPLSQTKEISLKYDQNSFSFGFQALHFMNPDSVNYSYIMQGYDNLWHDLGNTSQVSFFSLPPGHYLLKIRAVTNNAVWNEKTLKIVIHPPWWTTWWAIALFSTLLIAVVWGIIYLRSRRLRRLNKILEEKVNIRTDQLNQSLKDLKATQKQLVMSEKMASLGEVTAGIAHEIQNPLNFVNNFSELNGELIEELKEERAKPKEERDEELENELLNDFGANSEKISHHGKRAQAIVTSMLEHSRISSGKKEPTDINALIEEQLRLSYQAMKTRNEVSHTSLPEIEIKTDFDKALSADYTGAGKINIVPQAIGRVMLNLFNNAFYACAERSRSTCAERSRASAGSADGYVPTVTVSTMYSPLPGRGVGGEAIITVKDNGTGIPEKIKDKIFQPFFTTKPTGQGTGLGLSLSYEIVNAHGGEIKVESREGEGTEFIIHLNA